MSELESNQLLKVSIVRASGKKSEFNLQKFPDYHLILDVHQVEAIVPVVIKAFESSLYEAIAQKKDEVSVNFYV